MEKTRRVVMRGLFVFAVFLWLLISAGVSGAACSDATLNVCYAFSYSGECSTCGTPGPRAGVGEATFNGSGSVSGYTWAKSNNGNTHTNLPFTGTYTVNSDCSGSLTITETGTGSETRTVYFVIDVNNQIHGIQTNSGRVITVAATPCL